MGLFDFIKKVITSVRLGIPLKNEEINALKHLLENRASLAILSAASIVATLEALKPKDPEKERKAKAKVELIKTVLDTWAKRAERGEKEVIKESEVKTLERAFSFFGLDGKRVAYFIKSNFDVFLRDAINEGFERAEKEKKKEKRRKEEKKALAVKKAEEEREEKTQEEKKVRYA